MDSNSDIEIVPNSVDDIEEDHSLSSDSSTASVSSLPPLKATRKRVTQDHRSSSTLSATSSRKATTTVYNAASTSKLTSTASTSKILDASSSDIEIIAGPSSIGKGSTSKRGAGTDLTNRLRGRSSNSRLLSSLSTTGSKRASSPNGGIGGFKSAAAILKEEARKERKAAARQRSSSSTSASSNAAVSTTSKAAKSRDVSPALSSSSSGLDVKGKKREEESLPTSVVLSEKYQHDERQLEDEDDDIVELPPPSSSLQASTRTTSRMEDDDMAVDVNGDAESSSPGAAFRHSINKFKAPSIPPISRSGRNSGSSNSRSSSSLFAGGKDASDRIASSSTGLTVLADSSTASTSTSTSTSNKRARSKFTATTATTSEPFSNTKSQQLEIPIPFLAVINKCPTCNDVWTVHKDPKIKLNHIRKCAISKAYYSNESVNELVEIQVRDLQAIAEERNRRTLDGRTLFEGVLSRKGKDVQVVGVEKKKKKTSSLSTKGKEVDNWNEKEEEEEGNTFRQVVLSTQGGSTYSQATSTQVQKELTKRIKTAQRIERGDFLNVPATGAVTASSAALVRDTSSHSTSDGTGTGTGSGDDQASTTTGNGTINGNGGKSALEEAVSKGRKKKGTASLSAGVGSKNWLKAAQLLKAKEKEAATATAAAMAASELGHDASLLSTSHMGGNSITSTLLASSTITTAAGTKGKGRALASVNANAAKNRLVSYQESRFRIAEKVKDIAALRTRSSTIASIDSSDTSQSEAAAAASGMNAEKSTDTGTAGNYDMISRPYRNPSEVSYCLLDKAIQRGSEKEKQGYNAWDLAGSAEDTIKDRFVSDNPSSPPSLPTPPLQRYQPISDSDASDDADVPAPLSSNTPSNRNPQQSSLPSSPNPMDHQPSSTCGANHPPYPSPPSSPPIGKLSLSSPTSPRFPAYLRTSGTAALGHNHTHLDSAASASVATAVNSTENDSIDSGSSATAATQSNPTTTDNAQSSYDATNITYENSSNGLFKSSAALQALTQRLKASKITTTSSSSTNPIIARRAASAVAAAAARAASPSVALMNSVQLLPSVMALPVQALASTSGSPSYMSIRTFASSSTTHAVKIEQVEPLSPSSREGKVKKPRGRPRKVPLEDGETNDTAKASPKRKKKDATDSSPVSDTDEPSGTAAEQGTLAFTATKKGKTVAKRTSKKKADTDAPSPRKKKATAAENASTSVATTKFAPDYPGMPDYDSWTKEKLQAETGKYGYKPAGSKKVLISQLVRVWEVLHPELFPEQDKAESVPPWRARSQSASPKAAAAVKKPLKASKKKDKSESEDSNGVSDASQPKKASKKAATSPDKAKKPKSTKGKAIAAARAKRKAALSGSGSGSESDPDGEESHIHDFDEVGEEEVDTDTPPDELKSAGERLKEAVIKDEKFYLRILRYEPILFDDFEMILAATKIKMSKVALRDWLDSQGVIFYYDQSTGRNATRNGARKRHA